MLGDKNLLLTVNFIYIFQHKRQGMQENLHDNNQSMGQTFVLQKLSRMSIVLTVQQGMLMSKS